MSRRLRLINQIKSGMYRGDDVNIYYETAGRGKPLVFVHGFSLDTRMWDDRFEPFAKSFRVICYNMRGFGRSSVPQGKESYTHAEELRVLLGHLGMKRVSVVGLSLGDLVGISFSLGFPEMVNKLVLVDAVVRGYNWVTRLEEAHERAR